MTTKEHTAATDSAAHSARRELIQNGREVSLVAYDTERNLYVFDEHVPAPIRNRD